VWIRNTKGECPFEMYSTCIWSGGWVSEKVRLLTVCMYVCSSACFDLAIWTDTYSVLLISLQRIALRYITHGTQQSLTLTHSSALVSILDFVLLLLYTFDLARIWIRRFLPHLERDRHTDKKRERERVCVCVA
jgi:hypothetical protein